MSPRQPGDTGPVEPVEAPRSPAWRALERKWLKAHPECAACGIKRTPVRALLRLASKVQIDVHHILPYHLFPKLELDESNLISLCRTGADHHLNLGHRGNWNLYEPDVVALAAAMRKGI